MQSGLFQLDIYIAQKYSCVHIPPYDEPVQGFQKRHLLTFDHAFVSMGTVLRVHGYSAWWTAVGLLNFAMNFSALLELPVDNFVHRKNAKQSSNKS